MTITYHYDIDQGSADWFKLRCGILTASEMKHLVTPATLKAASNDKERAHFYRILSQRIVGYNEEAEDAYQGDDILRGHEDEIDAKDKYRANYAPVEECGFVTNDKWGFTIGYSPDGLVGVDGLIEGKSRRQRFQVETILEHFAKGKVPTENVIQVQTGLLVTERKWLDFVSYSGGMNMGTIRALPDPEVQEAIIRVATSFEARLRARLAEFKQAIDAPGTRYLTVPRRVEREIRI